MDETSTTSGPDGLDRRSLLKAGMWLAGGLTVAGFASACSSGLEDRTSSGGDASGGSGTSVGSATTAQPTEKFVRTDSAGQRSPLASQLGLCLVQVEGAIKQFADAAESEAESLQLRTFESINTSNSAKAIAQMNSMLQRKVGAMFVQDLNPAAQVPVLKNAIGQGFGTFSFNMPAHLQMTASQFEIGKQLARGTLDYIKKNLGNEAKLVHFNFDYNQAVASRDKGWREVMANRPPGVQIVADIPGNPETQEQGNKAMSSILQKQPDVNVVDGGDTVVLGALSALRAAGRGSDPKLALFGVNGDPQAVDEVKSGGPYKATYAFNFAILGSLLSDMADRWLKGLNIPQLAVVPAVAIDSPQAIGEYNKSIADPSAVYKTAEGTYFNLFGSTSYATRGSYFDGKVA
jgi:ribose transport system substrate-binding protein